MCEKSTRGSRNKASLVCSQESGCFQKPRQKKGREEGEEERGKRRKKIQEEEPGLEAQACNPSYLGGHGRKIFR